MTTTSVKDVGSVLNSGVMPGAAAGKAAERGFQTVWDSQAGAGREGVSYEADSERTVEPKDDAAKPGDDLRARDNSRKNIGKEKPQKATQSRKAEELDAEELEKAAELAGTVTAELIQQIADTFGVSVEEVQGIMTDMNLQAAELLQADKLSALLLQVSGAENSLALLTNEQLYADYQMLMEQGKAALEQCSEAVDMNPEELAQAIAQMTDEDAMADSADLEPAVEITTEDDGTGLYGLQGRDNVNAQVQQAQNLANAQSNQQNEDATQDKNSRQNAQADNGNLVLQTIRNENSQPQAVEAQSPTETWSTQTQDIMRQIMDFMRIQVKPDMSSLEMQLHPASLGTLQVHVASEGGVLTANFVTENETVKAAIESQMVQLKESFAEQGVKVEAIEVTVQTHQFEQNLEQGRGRQPQGETAGAMRTRTRRINLNGPDGLGLPEEMEAEDQLATEMMVANGQTVDYTA